MFADVPAEYRLLGALIDHAPLTQNIDPALFTGERIYVFESMRQTYNHYGELSVEGVERYYKRALPPEIEIARGAKPSALIDHLSMLATKRQMLVISDYLNNALSQAYVDRNEIAKILQLPPIKTTEDSSTLVGITEFVSDLQRKRSGQYRFIDTGISFLNNMMGNEWPRKALSVITGGPGGGKTALVCQSTLNMARDKQIPSLFVSLEMSKDRLISRYVANMTGINGLHIRAGTVTDEEAERINQAVIEFQKLPIYIIDTPVMTASDIAYQVRLHKELYGIEAFFVDFLQMINSDNYKNEYEAIGDSVNTLRAVARQENVAGIILVQQNRSHSGIDSLAGSGKIGQLADTVFEIKLDDALNDRQRPCILDFHKNRDGPVGASSCTYFPQQLRFA